RSDEDPLLHAAVVLRDTAPTVRSLLVRLRQTDPVERRPCPLTLNTGGGDKSGALRLAGDPVSRRCRRTPERTLLLDGCRDNGLLLLHLLLPLVLVVAVVVVTLG